MPMLAILSVSIFLGAGCFGGNQEVVEPESSFTPPEVQEETSQYIEISGDAAYVGSLYLLEDEGEVVARVLRGGESFQAVDGLQIAYGDTIEVEKGEAVLAYNQPGVTHILEGTEVTVAFPVIGETEKGQTKDSLWVRVETFGGRSWSRIEKLLELTDTFEVGAGNVIATIRGTAFDFRFSEGMYKLVVGGRTVQIVHRDDFTKRVVVTAGQTFEATEDDVASFLEKEDTDLQAEYVHPTPAEELTSETGLGMIDMIEDRFLNPPEEPVFMPMEPQIPLWMIEELNPEDRDRVINRLEASDEDAEVIRGVESEGGMQRVNMDAIELLGETFDGPVE